MGLLIRLVIIAGILYGGYTVFQDKIVDEKLPEWKAEYLNPEETRAELLNNLEIKLDDFKTNYEKIKSIDLEDIEDPELREIVKGIQENLTEEEFDEIIKLVEDIKDLNDNDGIANEAVGKILDKIVTEENVTPTPGPSPEAQQCSWVCE